MVQNRDIVKDLKVGMLVAVSSGSFPDIGKVLSISPNPNLDSDVSVHWMTQERAPHKPKWMRYFTLSQQKNSTGTVKISEIVLYAFELTARGALKKKSRDYLKKVITE